MTLLDIESRDLPVCASLRGIGGVRLIRSVDLRCS